MSSKQSEAVRRHWEAARLGFEQPGEARSSQAIDERQARERQERRGTMYRCWRLILAILPSGGWKRRCACFVR
jgi:hypothetical protein